MSLRTQYLKYRFLEFTSSGIQRKTYREMRKNIKRKILYKKLGPLQKALTTIENYSAYQKYYLLFKQRFNIEIPADVCGLGNHFELVRIKLKEIHRLGLNNTYLPLTECAQYQYLKTKNEKIYQQYLATLQQINFCSKNSLTWSVENFKKLFNKIKKEGYKPQKSAIVINEDNCICDGLHRASILLYLKGKEYEIPVIKVSQKPFVF